MDFLSILIFVAIIVLGLKLLFSSNKNKKKTQKKSAPKKAAAPQRQEPVKRDNRPQYVRFLDDLIAFIDSKATKPAVIYAQRPHKENVPVPADLEALPKPEGYRPGAAVVLLTGEGNLHAYPLLNGTILSDMTRGTFGKLLAKHYGMNCRLYTAPVAAASGKVSDRVLGFIISQNVDNGSQSIPQEKPREERLDVTQTVEETDDGGIAAIPVDIQNINASALAQSVIEWEDIDDADEEE